MPNYNISKTDVNYLQQKFQKISDTIAGNNTNSIRFNQQIPRHEFYNQQRNFLNINRMESNELKNFAFSNKMQNLYDSPVNMVGPLYREVYNNQRNQLRFNESRNGTRSMIDCYDDQFFRRF